MIKVSVPGKIHLLGEHTVVYGKPALLSAIDLRVTVTVGKSNTGFPFLRETVQDLIKEKFKVNKMPVYSIESDLPVGSGLGFSAAGSAAIIAALLSHFKIKWDKELVNDLAFEAEKVFHGTPSGGDNTTATYGGLIIFQKGVAPLPSQSKIKNFALINTGKPVETTKQMIEIAKAKIHSILDDQERLVRELLPVLKTGDETKMISIIKAGEKNLENIGVVGKKAKKIIQDIETLGGAAKISGAGGQKKGSGIIICYHRNRKFIEEIANKNSLQFFNVELGAEGLRLES
ncbi:MAG: mevalonate kinase [Microgenomates group bacterium Gr01-1014_7]|nr:MAG: mevalonate kinase [Microgenomates group bacterium Gr01-1014_7]